VVLVGSDWFCLVVSFQGLNETEERYQELQEKVASLGGAGGLDWVNQKAKDMKKEAEDLLSTANKSIDQLKSETNTQTHTHTLSSTPSDTDQTSSYGLLIVVLCLPTPDLEVVLTERSLMPC